MIFIAHNHLILASTVHHLGTRIPLTFDAVKIVKDVIKTTCTWRRLTSEYLNDLVAFVSSFALFSTSPPLPLIVPLFYIALHPRNETHRYNKFEEYVTKEHGAGRIRERFKKFTRKKRGGGGRETTSDLHFFRGATHSDPAVPLSELNVGLTSTWSGSVRRLFIIISTRCFRISTCSTALVIFAQMDL